MSLQGSITELQDTAKKLYLKLEQRFKENGLIREIWSEMAHDISQQKSSLKALPKSFWNQMKKNRNDLLEATIPYVRHQITENTNDISLNGCFELALQFEEPTILKIYVPIIRALREDRANQSLDLYIIVKAHLTRIVSMTGSFSGDPVIIQRSSLLLQSFEKEIQEYQFAIISIETKARAARVKKRKAPARKTQKRTKPTAALAKRSKTHHRRAKPLVKKVEIQRRRARR
jgi:hypothetical protein